MAVFLGNTGNVRLRRGSSVRYGKLADRIDPNDILLVSDEEPGTDDTISDTIQAQPKNRF